MWNIKIWRAKRLLRRIERLELSIKKFQSYIVKTRQWIRIDKKELKQCLNDLNPMEFFDFGKETGYLEKKKK